MAILNRLQRRSAPGRALLLLFYVLLIFGAVWMVYPFLLMMSGSIKSGVDARQMDIIPRYLFSDSMLFRKFLEQRYGGIENATAMTRAGDENGNRFYTLETIDPPPSPCAYEMDDWRRFLASAHAQSPAYYFCMGHCYGSRGMPEVTFKYIQALRRAFPEISDQDAMATILPEAWVSRNYQRPRESFAPVYEQMRRDLPVRYFYPVSVEGFYAAKIVGVHYGTGPGALERLNREWGTHYRSTLNVLLRPALPQNPQERAIWVDFVRTYLSSRFVAIEANQLPVFRQFLQDKYKDIAALNKVYGSHFSAWSGVPFPEGGVSPSAFADADLFLKSRSDLTGVSIRSPDLDWRLALQTEYDEKIGKLNEAWGSHYETFDEIPMPTLADDYLIMKQNRRAILWDLVTRNYRFAWDQIVFHGNGLKNTLIFCLLNIVTALIVNPLAAYALSRFQPRWGMTALFILMATMAFPGEVTQIPSFLLLRELGWLNTFAALVIPTCANGFSIFLLKGFFDSLPQDLYEAATIDGCGELRTFFSITIPLSTPILAVIALGAFASAYGSFMFALLVCQKESMWTLMVYVYQLQQSYNPPIVFAALIIAAIPTLVVFILCQNVIMKGIVVPVEK